MNPIAQRYAEFRATVKIPNDSLSWASRNPVEDPILPVAPPRLREYARKEIAVREYKPRPKKTEGPRPDEMRLKDWISEESERRGIAPSSLYKDIERKRYPGLKLRRVNSRVVFVKCDGTHLNAYTERHPSSPDEVPFKEWITAEAKRAGVTASAIYNRISRGEYPDLKLRRVNRRVVFVIPIDGTTAESAE